MTPYDDFLLHQLRGLLAAGRIPSCQPGTMLSQTGPADTHTFLPIAVKKIHGLNDFICSNPVIVELYGGDALSFDARAGGIVITDLVVERAGMMEILGAHLKTVLNEGVVYAGGGNWRRPATEALHIMACDDSPDTTCLFYKVVIHIDTFNTRSQINWASYHGCIAHTAQITLDDGLTEVLASDDDLIEYRKLLGLAQ